MTGLLPGLDVLQRYRIGWLRADLVAGLTVGAMLIPQSMAYAELAGLAPQFGFYAVIGALIVYALVGTSRHLGVGPEPGTAILAAAGVGAIAGGDPRALRHVDGRSGPPGVWDLPPRSRGTARVPSIAIVEARASRLHHRCWAHTAQQPDRRFHGRRDHERDVLSPLRGVGGRVR